MLPFQASATSTPSKALPCSVSHRCSCPATEMSSAAPLSHLSWPKSSQCISGKPLVIFNGPKMHPDLTRKFLMLVSTFFISGCSTTVGFVYFFIHGSLIACCALHLFAKIVRSSTWIQLQHLPYELFAFLAHFFPLDTVEAIGAFRDLLHDLLFGLAIKGREPAQQYVEYHSAGPDVTLLVIFPFQHFRGNVVGSAKFLCDLLVDIELS